MLSNEIFVPDIPTKEKKEPEKSPTLYELLEQYAAQATGNISIGYGTKETGIVAQENRSQKQSQKSNIPRMLKEMKSGIANQHFTSPQDIAIYLLGPDNPNRIITTGDFASNQRGIYIYFNGRYVRTSVVTLQGIVKEFFSPESRTSKQIGIVINEIKTKVPALTDDELDSSEDIINFQNGLFHLLTGAVTPHTPDVYSTVQIPYEYKAGLSLADAPTFHSFITKLTNGNEDDKKFLLEFIGAVLSNVPGFYFKCLLVLYGPGNTGKSLFRELVQHLIGHEHCHTLDIDKIENRFGTSQLFGKRLVGSADLPSTPIREISNIKSLTGGDVLNAEFKGENAFTFRYRGYLLYCCNQLPTFYCDRGEHVYRRFCIVKCENVIPMEEQDKHLLDKMLLEAPAIISVALSHFKDAVNRGYRFTESQEMLRLRREYEAENNSFLAFVNQHCILHRGKTKCSYLHRVYKQWCVMQGRPEERLQDIKQLLKTKYGIIPHKSDEYYYQLELVWTDFDEGC